MTKALEITDASPWATETASGRPAFDQDEARAFFRPRLNDQARLAAKFMTPLAFAAQHLGIALGYEDYWEGVELPVTADPTGEGYVRKSDTPFLAALVESGLMSYEPARNLLASVIECFATKNGDLRGYAVEHLGELRDAYLLRHGMMREVDAPRPGNFIRTSWGYVVAPPDGRPSIALRQSLVSPEDRHEVEHAPFESVLKGLLWLAGGDHGTNVREMTQRGAELLLARFDELAVGEGGPKLRRQRIEEMWKRIQDRKQQTAPIG